MGKFDVLYAPLLCLLNPKENHLKYRDVNYRVIQMYAHIEDILLVMRLYIVNFYSHLQHNNDILSVDHPMVVYTVSRFCSLDE